MVGKHPAQSLSDATKNLLPDVPLREGDPWYVDLASARGDKGLAILERLFRTKGASFEYVVFVSHRGAGKSTELLRFEHGIRDKYETLHYNSNQEMNPDEFDVEDFLITLCRSIESHMREVGTPIPVNVIKPVEDWFSEHVVTTTLGKEYIASIQSGFEMKVGIPSFAKLFTALSFLVKRKSEHKDEVKAVLRKYPGALLNAVNNLLDSARDILAPNGRQLLVVVDNLDRYSPKVVDSFLIGSRDTLRKLHCNMIFTPPLDLHLQPVSEDMGKYYTPFRLPSPKLRNRNDPYSTVGAPGLEPLLNLLRNRMELDKLIPEKSAQHRLVLASGGSVRELISLTRLAALQADGSITTAKDVEQVVIKERSDIRDKLDIGGYWHALGHVGATKRLDADPKCLSLLYHRYVFHYNGENWYDVHPLIAEMPSFAKAVTKAKSELGILET